MNTRIGSRRGRIVRASVGIALAAGAGLTVACAVPATAVEPPLAPGPFQVGATTAGSVATAAHLEPADRLAEAIRQEVEYRASLAEEYSGLPADRIEQRVAAATAEGRTARSVVECAALALAQRPLFTADTAERLVGGACS
ncbi:hypothetical protein [Agromyces sp. SYSU T00194]|uniref:hypothetical protein n=1 Tax=Agromyces chitinivorans TaxID=3158560 RepID=UPI00339443E4